MTIVQDELLYDGLLSRPWRQSMLNYLWLNDHLGIMAVPFGFNMLRSLDTPKLVCL